MSKTVISSDKAPAAIGTYSQVIKAGKRQPFAHKHGEA